MSQVPIKNTDGKVVGFQYCNDARVVATTYLCHVCGVEIGEDAIVWAREDGTLDTDKGHPFCESCLPEDPNDEGWDKNSY